MPGYAPYLRCANVNPLGVTNSHILVHHDPVRLSSSSPCFPILGAVYMQKVIVQHLAGPIYLPPQRFHLFSTLDVPLRLFYALRRAPRDLYQYYESLSRQMISRFLPFVRS